MMACCQKRKGKLSHVVVADLSRLARNVADQNRLIEGLADFFDEMVPV